ncbi:MAG: proline--tRNA ligase [Anaerolineae bacterium]|jgi:prolyl-tRNA synthetase|nr:proline--tRNA ligase [Anaerolineae bacterium]
MRMTRLFSQTLREAPAESEAVSHQLLLRAGFIRPLATGIFSYLPLAQRALTKIERIIREEIEAIGGQEITMPVVHPASLWKETGRWFQIGAEMGRFRDRADRDLVLAMTHEEVIADLVRKEIRSYRQLPQLLFHFQTKWRDDPRPRAGLIRVREFTMKDSYSLDADWEGLDRQYRAHYQAYFNIFNRCGLDVIAVASDTGMMGGAMAHEFMTLLPIGEDTLMLCDACGYAANRQVATFHKPHSAPEDPLPLEEIATPNVSTIADLAAFLDIPAARTAKAVFLVATVAEEERETTRFIFAVARGDMDVNETKLANAVHAKALRPALEEEIRAIGAEPGYGSPLSVHDAVVIVDDAIASSPNLVAGANRIGFHLRNVNVGRDFKPDIIADIAAAEAGDGCPQCGAPLRAERGVEVGNIFKLGTRYSEALGCLFESGNKEMKPVIMGSYGIGIGRALACIAEVHHDDQGLRWPISVAPYQVQLVVLGGKGIDALPVADRLYEELCAAGVEVLYDDREATPGVKFNDADLIGLPLRLTVAPRGLANGMVELKHRDRQERELVPLEEIIARIEAEIVALETALNARLTTRTFS